MTDFRYALNKCKETSRLSTIVVDEFLMNYAAHKEGMVKEMDRSLARFKGVTRKLQPRWINLIKAQYIVHRIFREGGLLKKYLHHAAVKALPEEQQIFLQLQIGVPWRYSYSVITANPETDFYEMEDVFNGELFLLFSPSVTQTLSENPVSLWFNLIAFNGVCFQTFGPVLPFKSFEPDDIFFFATELNPDIESEEDLMKDVEENPFPYLMLMSASNYPVTKHGEDEILHLVAEHMINEFDNGGLRKDFTIEYAEGIYRIKHRDWNEPPHLAAAYYIEELNTLFLSSMTDRGFIGLVTKLNKYKLKLPEEPDIRVHLHVLIALKDILGKDLKLDPYEKYFEHRSTVTEQEEMDKLNRLLSLALPFVNAGQHPDVEALAKEAGVDIETARELLSHSLGRINKLRNTIDKKGRKNK
jgi:hypothetical protein